MLCGQGETEPAEKHRDDAIQRHTFRLPVPGGGMFIDRCESNDSGKTLQDNHSADAGGINQMLHLKGIV